MLLSICHYACIINTYDHRLLCEICGWHRKFLENFRPLLAAFNRYIKKHKPYSISLEYHGSLRAFEDLNSLGFLKRETRPVIYTMNDRVRDKLDFSDIVLVSSDEDTI